MPRFTLRLTGFLLLALLLSGCFYSREIHQTRRAIEYELPGAEFDQRIVMSFGPASIGLARFITRFFDDPDVQNAHGYLRDVRRVKVGVYETEHLPSLNSLEMPRQFRRALERENWTLAAKIRDDEELVWVFYRERRESIRDMFVVVINDEEMVLARLKGRLNRIAMKAMEDYGSDQWTNWSAER